MTSSLRECHNLHHIGQLKPPKESQFFWPEEPEDRYGATTATKK